MSAQPGRGNPQDDVVVGFDGSHHAAAAVDWAAEEAVRRGLGLRVVVAAHYPGMPYPVGPARPIVPRSLEALSDELVESGLQRAAKRLPEGRIDARVVVAGPAAALLDASADAALLVVGHRGHGAFASAMLGSVSLAVAGHASCPVVVVRGSLDWDTTGPRPVSAGIDGTPTSEPALLFAAEEAARLGVPLRIVCAWSLLPRSGWEFAHWDADMFREMGSALSESARRATVEAADAVRGRWPDLVLEREAPEAPPPLALEDASRRSGLLVVGSRGASALGRLFLGSVSHAVLHHAACPVAVVRP